MEIKCFQSIFQKKELEEDIPEAGTSKDVLTEDLHTTPKRAISTRQSVRLVSKKIELDQFSPQKRKFMELLVLMIKEITDIFF